MAFIFPQNWTAQLLLIYMLLTDFLMGEFMLREDQLPFRRARKKVILAWINKADRALPLEYGAYLDLPRRLCQALKGQEGQSLAGILGVSW
jgi:hypothetical protein